MTKQEAIKLMAHKSLFHIKRNMNCVPLYINSTDNKNHSIIVVMDNALNVCVTNADVLAVIS